MKRLLNSVLLFMLWGILLGFNTASAKELVEEASPSDPKMEKINDANILRSAAAEKEDLKQIKEVVSNLQTPHFREALQELTKFADASIVKVLLKTIGNKENHPLLRAQAAWALGELFYCIDPELSMPELYNATTDEIELVSRSAQNTMERLFELRHCLEWGIFYSEQAQKSEQAMNEKVEKIYRKVTEKLAHAFVTNTPFDYQTQLTLLPEDKKATIKKVLEEYLQKVINMHSRWHTENEKLLKGTAK